MKGKDYLKFASIFMLVWGIADPRMALGDPPIWPYTLFSSDPSCSLSTRVLAEGLFKYKPLALNE